MSDKPIEYSVAHLGRVKVHIQAIADYARKQGNYAEYLANLRTAVERLRRDPRDWGEPKYRTPSGDGLVFCATARPIAYDYVVFEKTRALILLDVRLYADFD